MTELIEVRINMAGLVPEDRTLVQAFLAWLEAPGPDQLASRLQVLLLWEQAPASRQAMALKLLNAELSCKDVARLCGKSDRQLRRYTEYQRFTQLLRLQHELRRGYKRADGKLEAWEGDRDVRFAQKQLDETT